MDKMDKEKDQIFLENNDTETDLSCICMWNSNHILWDRTFLSQFSEITAI
jgi:hypothetical protein